MKILVKVTSDEPNYKELYEEKTIPLPSFMLTKKVQKEAFDLMKIQLKGEFEEKLNGTEITVDKETDTTYQFHFKQGEWTRIVYSEIV